MGIDKIEISLLCSFSIQAETRWERPCNIANPDNGGNRLINCDPGVHSVFILFNYYLHKFYKSIDCFITFPAAQRVSEILVFNGHNKIGFRRGKYPFWQR